MNRRSSRTIVSGFLDIFHVVAFDFLVILATCIFCARQTYGTEEVVIVIEIVIGVGGMLLSINIFFAFRQSTECLWSFIILVTVN